MHKVIIRYISLVILLSAVTLIFGCRSADTPPIEEPPTIEDPTTEESAYEPEDPSETEPPVTEDDPYEPYEAEPERVLRPAIADMREYYGNDHIIGYIYIEGTSIHYPVTQYTDNEFYLYHDIWGNPDRAGWIFLDYENDITREDPNVIIYGHNMRRDIRFHSIRHYVNRDFFDAHRYITFNTAYAEYRWEIFSFYITCINFFYIQVIFQSDEEFYGLLAEMKSRSMHDSGVEVGRGDRVLTLSTCVGNPENERFVVNARLIRDE